MALTGIITGKGGTVKQGDATLGSATEIEVTNWNLSIEGGALDVTNSGSGDTREYVPNKRKTASGSFEAQMEYGQTDLAVNTEIEFHLMAEDTTGDEVYYSFAGVLTNMSISTPIEGESVVMNTYNFTVNGTITKTDDSAA